MRITIGPAYGRDYKNKKDAEADFRANKDFVSFDMNDYGRAVNLEDCRMVGITDINLRYAKLTKVHVFKV